jgi:SAM-dependent methyltransferase
LGRSNLKEPSNVVRGYGPLDRFLADVRHRTAVRQIKRFGKRGRIVDIGCGPYPSFLSLLDFEQRYGLDQSVDADSAERAKKQGIILLKHELKNRPGLPFEDDYFDVVTMLAVFEHIRPEDLIQLHLEIYRILKPHGLYFMTTPAVWTDGLLRFLARMHLISDVEIKDHKGSYSHTMIKSVLEKAGFESSKVRLGYFELFMNSWAAVTK